MAMNKTRQLPPIRVDEQLELALLRAANAEDMTLSVFIRKHLELLAFEYQGRSVSEESGSSQPSGAMQIGPRRAA